MGTIMTTPAVQSLSLWNRLTGGNWEILEMWARGGWKWSLVEDSGRSSEGTGCQEKKGGRGQPQKLQGEQKKKCLELS